MSNENVVKFPSSDGGTKVELGPLATGHSVLVDGHCVPKLQARDLGDHVDFILDGRLCYTVPANLSKLFASAIGNAMAIGAGWPCLTAKEKAPFAPRVMFIDTKPSDDR